MEMILPNMIHGYRDIIQRLIHMGSPIEVRGLATYEIVNATLVFPTHDRDTTMLPVHTGRKVNTKLAAVEALQLIAEKSAPDLVVRAAPNFGSVMVNANDLNYGAYGTRAQGQMEAAVIALKSDAMSRQAIVNIWNPVKDPYHVGDKPCTIFLQFMIRANRLQLHTFMRSNDVWLGVPYDIFMFTQLQHTVANVLDIDVGPYVHHATSLHIYERDIEKAEAVTACDATAYSIACDVLPRGVTSYLAQQENEWWRVRDVARALLKRRSGLEVNEWYRKQIVKIP